MAVTYRTLVLLHLVATAIYALPAAEEARNSRNSIQTENDLLDSIYTDCLRKDSMSCVKYKLFSFVDKVLGNKDTITITDGVQIVKTDGDEPEGAPRALNGDETIENLLLNRVERFLQGHTIKVDLKGSDIVEAVSSTARSLGSVWNEDGEENGIEESRGKKKKVQRILGPLLAAAALKMAILSKLALAAIALIAGKALLVGKIALVLSAIIGLKKLLGSGGKHVTYEVVAHPQHSTSHVSSHETVYGGSGGGYSADVGGGYGGSSGHGGWQRSLDGQQLAYRGHPQVAQQ